MTLCYTRVIFFVARRVLNLKGEQGISRRRHYDDYPREQRPLSLCQRYQLRKCLKVLYEQTKQGYGRLRWRRRTADLLLWQKARFRRDHQRHRIGAEIIQQFAVWWGVDFLLVMLARKLSPEVATFHWSSLSR